MWNINFTDLTEMNLLLRVYFPVFFLTPRIVKLSLNNKHQLSTESSLRINRYMVRRFKSKRRANVLCLSLSPSFSLSLSTTVKIRLALGGLHRGGCGITTCIVAPRIFSHGGKRLSKIAQSFLGRIGQGGGEDLGELTSARASGSKD